MHRSSQIRVASSADGLVPRFCVWGCSMTYGSLFSGIGGLDRGFESAGFKPVWRVEKNAQCIEVLKRWWPNTRTHEDIRHFDATAEVRADLICGGDPCPAHSHARSNGDSKHPDLSGYFLSVVARCRPWWVVRENVPAPSVQHFKAALDYLGYGAVTIRIESSPLTGQLRQRDYIVGRYQATQESVRNLFPDAANGRGPYTTRLGTREITPALTTHRTRYDSRDCYIWEQRNGLRILDAEEREALAGFPAGWTAGFSEATRARMLGNSAPPQVAEWIGKHLKPGGAA